MLETLLKQLMSDRDTAFRLKQECDGDHRANTEYWKGRFEQADSTIRYVRVLMDAKGDKDGN